MASIKILPACVPTFGMQGSSRMRRGQIWGLLREHLYPTGGDQPNNALSLNVLRPEKLRQRGRLALYMGLRIKKSGSTIPCKYVCHVNHTRRIRGGVLLCINGTGILNAWTRRLLVTFRM